jgi:hypothetical protein
MRSWVLGQRAGEPSPRGLPAAVNALDCSDGLARCEAGVVSVSRLGTVPLPCSLPPPACACPWEQVADCDGRCAVDGLELVIDRSLAPAQLCAPGPDAGVFARATLPVRATITCEEGQRHVCSAGLTIECASGSAVGFCTHGCYVDGASIDDDGVSREAAFAILCSR